ncbi:SWIM zinc finger family protein [Jiangella alba]|uniref:SWIM zinc finger n=1 Tax=Jiangella alba TaxID=561176 RepID=A0A1H5MXV9_9ACTN|nr:SWIM zinc finger family protein [Jiangella alba]SEE93990.1 SWIM zinc finger [Jiangella alba]
MSAEVLGRVRATLARWDDEAWTAVANRGLLRRARKDLESVAVTLAEDDEQRDAPTVAVAVGDNVVRMGPSGPADATCTCPSAVLCQHIITAGLWLAAQQEADTTPSLSDELMALEATTMTRYAGLPGYRWAHQHLDDLDPDHAPTLSQSGYLAVTFAQPELTIRYLGGGLDGLVLDQNVPHPERYRVAAVLAWQRAHGLRLPPPPPPRSGSTKSGRPATETARSLAESRARLRTTAGALLRDMVAVGVSHLSPAIRDRVVTAATWAQGVEYHRLARLLRRIGDQVDLMLARSAAADDLALLGDVTTAHALVAALDAAAATGSEPATLLGRARTAYDPVRSLDLMGLGGSPWRTGSGYHGLTCVYWSPSRRRIYTWTDTRPENVPGFDPRHRWEQPAPWTGLTTPAAAAGRRVVLTHAQVSPDGRLSGVEVTSAAVTALDSRELMDQLPVQDSWETLALPRPRALTDVFDPTGAWAVLQPARALPARWDPSDQTLTWTLLDHQGETAAMRVPWSRLHAHAIERLEALGSGLPDGALVVARLRRTRGQLVGEPLSLVMPDRAHQPVDSLHFDPGSGQATSSLVDRLLRSGVPDQAPADDEPAASPVPAALAELRALVEQEAQRGCTGAPAGAVVPRLATAHAALRKVGFPVFADPDRSVEPAEALLRSLYLVQQVETALM